jgi:hypothetical protein
MRSSLSPGSAAWIAPAGGCAFAARGASMALCGAGRTAARNAMLGGSNRGSFRRALSSAAVLTLSASGQSRDTSNPATRLQSTAVSSLPSATAPTQAPPAVQEKVPDFNAPVGLLSAAVMLFAAIGAFVGAQEGGGPELWFSLQPVFETAPTSMALFFAADAFAQTLGSKDGNEFDVKRALSCAMLGVGVNSLGFQFWLHYLDSIIPPDTVGIGSAQDATRLLGKSLVDSFVWGTISNSIGIFMRQAMAGAPVQRASALWERTIIPVMQQDVKFWTVWMSLCYSVIPNDMRVQWVALGALFFNIYLSSVSTESSDRQ